jgi:prevent-host-death family protein
VHGSAEGGVVPERRVSASELRRRQGRLLFEVQAEQLRVEVLRYGRPVAWIVPVGDLDGPETAGNPLTHL